MPQTALPFGRKAVLWTIRVVLGMMAFPALVVSVYEIVALRQKHSDGAVSLVVLALVLWVLFFALYLTGWLFEKRIGIGKDSSVHASTISEVAIYGKNEGARTDSHPENPEDGSKAPFTDNKIALYLSYVNGGGNERG